jgi:hypothetical protein
VSGITTPHGRGLRVQVSGVLFGRRIEQKGVGEIELSRVASPWQIGDRAEAAMSQRPASFMTQVSELASP